MIITTLLLIFALLPKTEAWGLGENAEWGFRRQRQPLTPLQDSGAPSEM